jgi:hypothetical protein
MGNAGCVVLKQMRTGGRPIQGPRMPMNSLRVEGHTKWEHCWCFRGNSNHLAAFPSLQLYPQDGAQHTTHGSEIQLHSQPSLSLTQSFWMHTMCRFTCPREKPKFIRFEMFFRPRGRKGRGEAGLGEVSQVSALVSRNHPDDPADERDKS